MSEPSLQDKVVALDRALTKAKIDHAFGGALALAYYAEPRATVDVDINVFIPPNEHEAVFAALGPLGVARPEDAKRLVRDGQSRWRWGPNPVDLFFANDPIHAAMKRDVRKVPFADARIPILSPEHLVVCKVLFDRPKDWLDIEQVLVAETDLDLDEIRGWLTKAFGPEDSRLTRFEALIEP
ncbi:MAG: hypothetical protein QOI31_2037 [Solirubrobacterales bacterium]|jgi:hypothetical protein|nr:hypothetical protein [Solirubrobacterales bacterium]